MIRYTPTPQNPPHSTSCARSLTERMASHLREECFAGRGDVQSLRDRGWSKAAIERLGPAAMEIARRQSVRQIARA